MDDYCLYDFLLDWNAGQLDCYSSATQGSICKVKYLKIIQFFRKF